MAPKVSPSILGAHLLSLAGQSKQGRNDIYRKNQQFKWKEGWIKEKLDRKNENDGKTFLFGSKIEITDQLRITGQWSTAWQGRYEAIPSLLPYPPSMLNSARPPMSRINVYIESRSFSLNLFNFNLALVNMLGINSVCETFLFLLLVIQ